MLLKCYYSGTWSWVKPLTIPESPPIDLYNTCPVDGLSQLYAICGALTMFNWPEVVTSLKFSTLCVTAVTVARSGRLCGSQAWRACQGLRAARLTRLDLRAHLSAELVFSFASICKDPSVRPWASPVPMEAVVRVTKAVDRRMVSHQSDVICCADAGEQISSV